MVEPPDPVLDLLGDPPPPPELIEIELIDRPDVTVGAVDLDMLEFGEIPAAALLPPVEAELSLPGVETQPVDIARERENVRGQLALSLVAILAFIVFGAFFTLWTGWDGSNQAVSEQATQGLMREALAQEDTTSQGTPGAGTEETPPPEEPPATEVPSPVVTAAPQQTDLAVLLQILLSPVIGLVGAATGFYFGGLSGKSEEQST